MTVSLIATLATSIRDVMDQDISFEQALVVENIAIDVALVLEDPEVRENFITRCMGLHEPCSSRWSEVTP